MSTGADQARAQAREILAERRFRETDLPRPFGGALDWLGGRLRELARPFEWLGDHIPGGDFVLWTLLAAVVVVLAVWVSARLVRRRVGAAFASGASSRAGADDPRRLEREADEAERAGDLELVLRLRFRAGVLRLAERDVVSDPRSVTTGQLRRRLRSPAFEQIGSAFDEVVYGGRPAQVDDAHAAREGWPRVISEASR